MSGSVTAGEVAPVARRSAVRNSLVVLAARIVSRGIALVTVVVLANHLGDARYGRYVTMVAYSALVSVLADLGLNTLYTREAAREPGAIPVLLATLAAGKLVLGVAAFAVLAAALAFAGVGELVLPGGALLLLTTFSALARNTFYALGRLEFEAVAILLEIAVQAAGILAGARLGFGVAWFVWVYAASAGATLAFALVVIGAGRLAAGAPRVDPALLLRSLRTAFPFAVGFALTNLYFRADVPILQHFRPFAEVGWYQFAYKPFEALQFIPLAVQTVVYPLLAVLHRDGSDRLRNVYADVFRVLLLVGWPLGVGTFVLVHPVGRLFRLFPQSEPSLRILALGIVFLFVNSAFTAMLYAIDRQDLFAWATAVAVVVNVGLNLALIPAFGYLAASATTALTEAAFAATAWALVSRRHPLPVLRLSWRILVAGLVMGLVLQLLAARAIWISVPAGILVYGTAVAGIRGVTAGDLRRFGAELLRRGPA